MVADLEAEDSEEAAVLEVADKNSILYYFGQVSYLWTEFGIISKLCLFYSENPILQ